ncbi:hypothetical protein FRC06_008781 [Ceratobasidium sp. 370]|nr:hypothetical protein FRC06_008781 [Ceratobasidium sp. 370]
MGCPTIFPDCSLINSPTPTIKPGSVAPDVESLLSRNKGGTRMLHSDLKQKRPTRALKDPSTRQVPFDHLVTTHDFGDSDIEIWVNHTAFKTQRRLIKKFAVLCSLIEVEGQNDQAAIVIDSDECIADDFYGALVVLHASAIHGPYHFDVSTLISALSLATKYDYPDLRDFAISNLGKSGLGFTDRIQLARKYNISDWEATALEELCERDEPIAAEEADAIGLETFVRVAHIREERISNMQGRRMKDQDRSETGDLRAETEGWFKTVVLNELENIRDQISSQGKSLKDIMDFGSENLQVSHEHYDFAMKRNGYKTS